MDRPLKQRKAYSTFSCQIPVPVAFGFFAPVLKGWTVTGKVLIWEEPVESVIVVVNVYVWGVVGVDEKNK